MKNFWQVFQGVMIALVSIGLILGGFSLSMSEGNVSNILAPIPTLLPTLSPTLKPTTTATPTLRPTPSLSPTSALSLTPSLTASLPPSPTNCPPPVGWLPYVVQPGDTFALIATRYNTNSVTLQQANCLQATGLNAGLVIYVPPVIPTNFPTKVPISCGAPSGWIVYFVQPGDTLYHLSVSYGITVADLQRANCLGSSDLLRTGQRLYVPPWAPLYPSPTPPLFIPTPTDTLPELPSDTPVEIPTATSVPVASDTPVEIPIDPITP